MSVTACIVQARMNSERLPGKVLLDLAGATVLSHVLQRCHAIEGVDVVVCATVDEPNCDPVAEEAERCGAVVFRGSESDVLGRYYEAAKSVQADTIIRVTSDCPLIDPAICAAVLAPVVAGEAGYANNNSVHSWPHGLDCEAMSFSWLERAHKEAVRPSHREHVTMYIRDRPDVNRYVLEGPGGVCKHHRWVVDTKSDYDFMKKMFARLNYEPEPNWDWRIPLAIVEREPELAALNPEIDKFGTLRKSLQEDLAAGYSLETAELEILETGKMDV